MATTYSFKIGNTDVKYSDSKTIKIDGTEYLLSLLSLRYFKKMYQPGHVEAKLQIRQNAESGMKAPELVPLVAFFRTGKNEVNLSKTVDGKSVVIAENYYVNRVIPEYKRSEKGQYVQVTLHIYSPDHKLTLDKYCRAYTNRKLATDILKRFDEKDSIMKAAGFTSDNVDTEHLKFLRYVVSNKDNQIEYEQFLQPYLVQYNESFFDFMARTANRCGEYFYYENGKLHLGVDNFSDAPTTDNDRKDWVDIDRDSVLSYRYSMAQEELMEVFDHYHNSLKSKDQSSSSAYSFNNELPLDEYLGNLVEINSYTNTLNEFFPKMWGTIPEAIGALTTGGIAGIVAWAVPTVLMGTFFAESVANTKNKIFNEKWVWKDGAGPTGPTMCPGYIKDRFDKSTMKTSLFGTQMSNDVKAKNYVFQQNIDANLYNFIGFGSKIVSENLVDICLPVEHKSFLLGQDVTFESKSDVANKEKNMKPGEVFNFKHYNIIEVSEVIKAEAGDQTKEEWQLGQKITIAPLYSVVVSKYNETATTNLEIPCPPVMCPFIKTSGTQRAIIYNSVDPLRYGRVQITYPWQNSTENPDCSPFIRQAVPYVPSTDKFGGGFYFQLEKGTEVLVDYENGNIERPFVIGCLYSKNAKAPRDGYTYTGGWSPSLHPDEPKEPLVISSKKGHKIKFDDNGNLEDFLMGASPAIELSSLVWKHLIPSEYRLDQKGESELSGGLSICDKWGIYKINCSTTKRSISIDSPFGAVNLNAFTGITINCPNGDVTIKGKNIKLEAGNEISIHSGTNINPPGHSLWRDTIAKGAVNALLDKFVLPMVDLRLVRTVAEIFLKPAAGTLNLKSNRYLLLGAGLGKPEIPTSAYSAKGLDMKVYHDERGRLHRQLGYTGAVINGFFLDFSQKYKVLRTDINSLVNKLKSDGDKAQQRKNFVEAAYTKKDFTIEDFEFNNHMTRNRKQQIVNEAIEIAKNQQKLLKICEDVFVNAKSMDFDLDGAFTAGTFKKVLAKESKKVVPTLVQGIIDKTELFNKPDEDLVEMEQSKRIIKRYLMYHIIVGTYGVEYVPSPTKIITFDTIDDFADNQKWLDWVNNLHKYTGKSINGGPLNQQEFEWRKIHKWGLAKIENAGRRSYGPLGRFFGEVKDESAKKVESYNPYNAWKERDIWGPGQKGEILISDKGGQDTINIVNGALNRTENSDGYTNKIKAFLSSVY